MTIIGGVDRRCIGIETIDFIYNYCYKIDMDKVQWNNNDDVRHGAPRTKLFRELFQYA